MNTIQVGGFCHGWEVRCEGVGGGVKYMRERGVMVGKEGANSLKVI